MIYNDVTLHFDFGEFEKVTFMTDDAYHRLKGEMKSAQAGCDMDDGQL